MSSGSSVEDQPVSIGSRESYLGDYYEHLAEEDFRAYPQEVLTARTETHRQVAATRQPGMANIAIVTRPTAASCTSSPTTCPSSWTPSTPNWSARTRPSTL